MGKKITVLVLTALTVFVLGVVSYTFEFVTSTRASIYEEIDRTKQTEERMENLSLRDGDPISILLMGIDTLPGETVGRADTMILMTVNPQEDSMQMVSIPRDTYINIPGGLDKINSAYQVGGAKMAVHSVEKLLDIPVDYFASVNMNGFEGLVDAYGGVEVKNDLDFTDEHVHFPKGEIKLDGKEALIYARMRKKDPRGDFGRQLRQRQVIEALMEKGESITSFNQSAEIVNVIKNNVKTNMGFIDMWQIQSNYKGARDHIREHKVEGKDSIQKGTYYYLADKKKLDEISNTLKKHLELPHDDVAPVKDDPEKEKQANDSKKEKSELSEEKNQINPEKKIEEKESPKNPEAKGEESDNSKPAAGTDNQQETPQSEEQKQKKESAAPEPSQDSDEPNVEKVITDNWSPVPTSQENHTRVTFEEGSVDWKEMTAAIAKGAGLPEGDMILWWVAGNGANSVIATVTNKSQTENYRVYVSWVDGAGYKPTKVEVLRENDKK